MRNLDWMGYRGIFAATAAALVLGAPLLLAGAADALQIEFTGTAGAGNPHVGATVSGVIEIDTSWPESSPGSGNYSAANPPTPGAIGPVTDLHLDFFGSTINGDELDWSDFFNSLGEPPSTVSIAVYSEVGWGATPNYSSYDLSLVGNANVLSFSVWENVPGHAVVESTSLDEIPQIPTPSAGSFAAKLTHSSFGHFDLQTIAAVPEPGTGVLLSLGLTVLGIRRRA